MSIKNNLFDLCFALVTFVIIALGFHNLGGGAVQSHSWEDNPSASLSANLQTDTNLFQQATLAAKTVPAPNQDLVKQSTVSVTCGQNGGSGIMVDGSGLVLTNAHLIFLNPETKEITPPEQQCLITIPNTQTGAPYEMYFAQAYPFTAVNQKYDLAFLKITTDNQGHPYQHSSDAFTSITDGCLNRQPQLGENIRIYGYPVTSSNDNLTITEGLVSNFDDGGLILTSAKIDHGNSGGLAVDQNNCMVGVPNAVITGDLQNLGTIIPLSIVDQFLAATPESSLTTLAD